MDAVRDGEGVSREESCFDCSKHSSSEANVEGFPKVCTTPMMCPKPWAIEMQNISRAFKGSPNQENNEIGDNKAKTVNFQQQL